MSCQSSHSVLAKMNNVNNHASSYTGSNNDENVRNTSRTFPVELKLFMMHFVGKEPARTLVRLHCIELEKKTVSCHEIKDPLSDVLRQHLKPTPITNAAAVYAKVLKHPDRSVIIKIGSTSRFRNRINWDTDKDKEKEKNDYPYQ